MIGWSVCIGGALGTFFDADFTICLGSPAIRTLQTGRVGSHSCEVPAFPTVTFSLWTHRLTRALRCGNRSNERALSELWTWFASTLSYIHPVRLVAQTAGNIGRYCCISCSRILWTATAPSIPHEKAMEAFAILERLLSCTIRVREAWTRSTHSSQSVQVGVASAFTVRYDASADRLGCRLGRASSTCRERISSTVESNFAHITAMKRHGSARGVYTRRCSV